MIKFNSFQGMVTQISDFPVGAAEEVAGCYKMISVTNTEGEVVNFVVSPMTYFLDNFVPNIGEVITGYYDGNAPVPMIFPPQYQALVIVRSLGYLFVKVDFFDSDLISSDGQLKLNVISLTQITLTNGLQFTKEITNRNLIVIYGPSTRSIPSITTPARIIVLCS